MQGNNNRRRKRRLAIAWIASAVLTLGLAALFRNGTGLPPAISIPAGLLIIAAITTVQIYYWRTLDEFARAIQTHAFFWSGLTTWGLFAILVVIAPLFPSETASLAQMGATGGALMLLFVHAVLFLALWGWAWMKPR
jgi:hypothetical protein